MAAALLIYLCVYWQKRQNKYGNISSSHNGHTYHSKKEAAYAQELDIRVKIGELEHWERQVPIELRVNDQKICTYTIDFVEYDHKGNVVYTEVKGFETPEWRLKWKLFDALYPEWEKQVIK
jgi:hypothetical protein